MIKRLQFLLCILFSGVLAYASDGHNDLKFRKNIDYKQRGFLPIVELQYSFPVGTVTYFGRTYNNVDGAYGIRATFAYQFSNNSSLGPSFGFQTYGSFSIAQVGIDARYALSGDKVSPLLQMNVGLRIAEDNYRFIYINPALGLRIYVSQKTALIISPGYKWEPERITFYGGPFGSSGSTQNLWWKYVTLHVGLSF